MKKRYPSIDLTDEECFGALFDGCPFLADAVDFIRYLIRLAMEKGNTHFRHSWNSLDDTNNTDAFYWVANTLTQLNLGISIKPEGKKFSFERDIEGWTEPTKKSIFIKERKTIFRDAIDSFEIEYAELACIAFILSRSECMLQPDCDRLYIPSREIPLVTIVDLAKITEWLNSVAKSSIGLSFTHHPPEGKNFGGISIFRSPSNES